ncbi:ABC transporter substrate-binding protein [Bacillus suaedae]|uniref:Sugar ABC transporter substrate-binding protein n=1 Tax=Halalkalibacter suaedae TaxID=2822140 RepID=A0A941AQB2_9BACI|nr:sugar ABC transporter substrate-binding protein [Bacillus suaedae]MBP3950968.1 sugar ABC transporter substrate-binding protein [Bacillus suaedae]
MKKIISSIMILFVLLVGCGSNTESNADGTNDETTTLTVWVMGSDDHWKTYHDDLIERFEQENKNIEVEVDYIPWAEGENKLVTAATNNRLPDVTTIAGRWTPQLVAMEAVEPLDSYFDEAFQESFVEGAWNTTQYQGSTWGLPIGFTTTGLFYRTDWLEDAGFNSPPTTWEEFVDVAKAFTAEDRYGFGLVGSNGMETTMFWAPFLWSNGGELLNDDLTEATFNSPEGVEALEFYTDLLLTHKVAPEGSINYGRGDSQDLFVSGAVGMTTVGPWFPKTLAQQAPEMEYSIAPYPVKKESANLGTADHIIMSKQSENKETAWTFMEFFTNEENDMKWAEYQGFIPYHKANLENDPRKDDPEFKVFFDVAPDAVVYPTMPEWPQIDQAIADAIQESLTGTKTPQQALDDAAEKVNLLLAK